MRTETSTEPPTVGASSAPRLPILALTRRLGAGDVARADLKAGARLVLLCLASHAHVCRPSCPRGCTRDGLAFPAVRTIADWAGLGHSAVSTHLAALVRDGWIEAVAPARPAARTVTRYRLTPKAMGQPSPSVAGVDAIQDPDGVIQNLDDAIHNLGGAIQNLDDVAQDPDGAVQDLDPICSGDAAHEDRPTSIVSDADAAQTRARAGTSSSMISPRVGGEAERAGSERPAPVAAPAHPWLAAVTAELGASSPPLVSAALAVCRAAGEHGQGLPEVLTAIRTLGENVGEGATRAQLMSYIRNQHPIDDDEERARVLYNATTAAQRLTVGRIGAAIVVDEPTVSRHHATVAYAPDGSVVIADAASANGLFVRGQRVDVATLQDGDTVHLSPQVAMVAHVTDGRLVLLHSDAPDPEPTTAEYDHAAAEIDEIPY